MMEMSSGNLFCTSSTSSVLKSGLEVKFARPAILTQAKFLPTNTNKFTDGVAIFWNKFFMCSSRDCLRRDNLHQCLLQYQRFIQPA